MFTQLGIHLHWAFPDPAKYLQVLSPEEVSVYHRADSHCQEKKESQFHASFCEMVLEFSNLLFFFKPRALLTCMWPLLVTPCIDCIDLRL